MKGRIQLFYLLLLGVVPLVNADPVVGFSHSQVNATTGQVVSLDIVMTSFPKTDGGGINLRYNPKVLKLKNLNISSSTWSFVNKIVTVDEEAGIINGILFSSYSGVSADALIATVEFLPVKSGKSSLSMEESAINPFAAQGYRIPVSFQEATLVVRGGKLRNR